MSRPVPRAPKMIGASAIAADYGFTPRHWIAQAAAGKIPGAYQPSGARGKWMFDRETFERWWSASRKEVSAWPGHFSAAKPIGRAPSVTVESSGQACARRVSQLLKSACENG